MKLFLKSWKKFFNFQVLYLDKIKDYENVGSSSDNTHGNVHFEKGETKTITLYYLITDEEFENETLAIDFHYYGSPCKGTLAIVHEPETN